MQQKSDFNTLLEAQNDSLVLLKMTVAIMKMKADAAAGRSDGVLETREEAKKRTKDWIKNAVRKNPHFAQNLERILT